MFVIVSLDRSNINIAKGRLIYPGITDLLQFDFHTIFSTVGVVTTRSSL